MLQLVFSTHTCLQGIVIFHVLLGAFTSMGWFLTVIGVIAHLEYYTFVASFPFIQIPSVSFIVSLGECHVLLSWRDSAAPG